MKTAVPGQKSKLDSRDLGRIQTSLVAVRILHYASAGHLRIPAVAEQLRRHGCAMGRRTLVSLLVSLGRNGWLKLKTTSATAEPELIVCCLTPEGGRVLNLLTRHLEQLTAINPATARSKPAPLAPRVTP